MGENAIKVFDIEKAIERCEELIKPENANWIGISNQEAIKTVLNMLKEKDKEIEFQKDINKIEKNRHKKTEKSLKGQIIKNNKIIEKLEKEAQGYFEENIKKDKQIDLMAEQLKGVPINKNIPNFEKPNLKECITIFTNKEDIKQYYKNKAEKE